MLVSPETSEVDITQGVPFFLDPASAGDVSIYPTIKAKAFATEDMSAYVPYKMRTTQAYDGKHNVIINGGDTFQYTMVLSKTNSNAIPCTYNHGDIQIQYTVYETGDENNNFDLTWNCEASCVFPTDFTNTTLITDKTWIESDNSDVDVSNVTQGTTFIQRFYMQAYPKPQPDDGSGYFPSTTLTFSVKNNLTEFASFANIITKAAIFYYSDFTSLDSSDKSDYEYSIDERCVIRVVPKNYRDIEKVVINFLSMKDGSLKPFSQEAFKYDDTTWCVIGSKYNGINLAVYNYYIANPTDENFYAVITGVKEGDKPEITAANYEVSCRSGQTRTETFPSKYTYVVTPKGVINVTDLSNVLWGVNFFGIKKEFTVTTEVYEGDARESLSVEFSYYDLPNVARTQLRTSDYNFDQFMTLIYKSSEGTGEGETDDATRVAFIKINEYDEWIQITDGQDITFSQNFEFATGDIVASNDIFNFGYKKKNTILVKSDKEYDISLKVSHNVYKGMYTDLNDEMKELYSDDI